MIHVFKSGGDWKIGGNTYDVKCINEHELSFYLEQGYFVNKDDCKHPASKKRTTKEVSNDNE